MLVLDGEALLMVGLMVWLVEHGPLTVGWADSCCFLREKGQWAVVAVDCFLDNLLESNLWLLKSKTFKY